MGEKRRDGLEEEKKKKALPTIVFNPEYHPFQNLGKENNEVEQKRDGADM